MSLKSIVKVSHITNLSDARYCAGMGVEMLGFCVIPGQKHYMSPPVFQDIRGWISGPKIVAELYGISSSAQLEEILSTYAPDCLELNFDEFESFKDKLTLPCLVYHDQAAGFPNVGGDDRITHVIVNERASCEELAGVGYAVLSQVSSIEKLNQRISDGCFQGYVLDGPKEIRPGVTNYDQLGSILEMLEDEN